MITNLSDINEIRRWVRDNTKYIPWLGEEEIDHITKCLSHLAKWYQEDYPIGDFLRAVLKNNLSDACGLADDTNKRVLHIYPMFLYNNLPNDYKEKAKKL